jgi:hypothetical protein
MTRDNPKHPARPAKDVIDALRILANSPEAPILLLGLAGAGKKTTLREAFPCDEIVDAMAELRSGGRAGLAKAVTSLSHSWPSLRGEGSTEEAGNRKRTVILIDHPASIEKWHVPVIDALLRHRRIGNVKLHDEPIILVEDAAMTPYGPGDFIEPTLSIALDPAKTATIALGLNRPDWIEVARSNKMHPGLIAFLTGSFEFCHGAHRGGNAADRPKLTPNAWRRASEALRSPEGATFTATREVLEAILGEEASHRLRDFIDRAKALPTTDELVAAAEGENGRNEIRRIIRYEGRREILSDRPMNVRIEEMIARIDDGAPLRPFLRILETLRETELITVETIVDFIRLANAKNPDVVIIVRDEFPALEAHVLRFLT